MDVQMPIMDGLQATRHIRQAEAADNAPRLPIIAMTANAMVGMREEYMAAGMDDYVPKPFRAEALLAVAARWCAQSADHVSTQAPAPAGPVLFDDTALAPLENSMPAESFSALITGFVQSGTETLHRISQMAEAQDLAGLRKMGHDIISSAGNCGLMQLSELGRALQNAARAGTLPEALAICAEIAHIGPASWEALRVRFVKESTKPQ
jgi:CheY-like chemotaxis protein